MVVEESTVLYDELYELVKPTALQNVRKFLILVATYIDKNSESLQIIGPYKRLYFSEATDEKPVFQMFGVTEKEIKKIISKSPLIKTSFRTLNNPLFFLLTTLSMIYRESKDQLSKEASEYAMLYMALRFYSSRQGRIFPHEANKEIMEYTINNLNNKYLIKTEKTILGLLKHIVKGNDETVGTRLKVDHTDSMFKYFITNISTKINNTLSNILQEYMKNYERKKYLNSDTDRYDDENDTIKELTNLSATIIGLVDRVYNKMKTNPISEKVLLDATGITKLKVSSVKNTLEELIDEETDVLREMITTILQVYFLSGKRSVNMVKSKQFYVICMNVYKVSNTKDPLVIKIKQILDSWIKQYGAKYIRLNREATLINFRKAVYIYIVDCIIDYS